MQSKRTLYLLGYIAAIEYHDGHEWSLTKSGDWSSMWARSKAQVTHVWPTRPQAERAAQKQIGGRFPVYTRGYAYETPTPQDLPLFADSDTARVYLQSEPVTA